ncbi:MAG: hypothetical protein MJZ12_00235 [Prevotella sp.]|nr:hypothetical protein [Prevotella sp.]
MKNALKTLLAVPYSFIVTAANLAAEFFPMWLFVKLGGNKRAFMLAFLVMMVCEGLIQGVQFLFNIPMGYLAYDNKPCCYLTAILTSILSIIGIVLIWCYYHPTNAGLVIMVLSTLSAIYFTFMMAVQYITELKSK